MIIQKHSPVSQDFIWVARYADDTLLPEFDYQTKKENSFYDIDRDRLFSFSLVGHGHSISFERNGLLNVCGIFVRIYLETPSGIHKLNNDYAFNITDIIVYKDAEACVLSNKKHMETAIVQYNIGYKHSVLVDGNTVNVKPIIHVPQDKPIRLSLWLSSNEIIEGIIILEANGVTRLRQPVNIEKGMGGQILWEIS